MADRFALFRLFLSHKQSSAPQLNTMLAIDNIKKGKQNMKTFYRCPICGNIIDIENFSGNVPFCCGHKMEKMTPDDSDGAKEKHVPSCITEEHKVKVSIGSELHPMDKDHHIEWVALETDRGFYKKYIPLSHEPRVCFHLGKDEKAIAVFSYCNLHGLWVSMF